MNNLSNIAEVTLRYSHVVPPQDQVKINSVQSAVGLIRIIYSDYGMDHIEHFFVVLLSQSHRVLGYHHVSQGGVSGTVADVKVIYQSAIKANASAIILTHNHPSGSVLPSQSDIDLTNRVVAGGKVLDIRVLDHIIVSTDTYHSFDEQGQI